MKQSEQGPDSTPLQRALEAEREARQDIERAEVEAREIVDAARARVREIGRRADTRIGRISRSARAQTERLLEQLFEDERAALAQLEHSPEDRKAIEAAARRLASALTGGTRSKDSVND